MSVKLYQRRFFEERWFSLTDTGISVRYKKIGKIHEFELNYEDMGTRTIKLNKDIALFLYGSIGLMLLAIVVFIMRVLGSDVENGAELFYIAVATVMGAAYFITLKKSVFLVRPNNTYAIDFIADKPSKDELENFIDKIRTARRDYLLKRYAQLNPKLSYEQQHNNFLWLLNAEVISEQEFKDALILLDKMFPAATSVKGFSFGDN